MNIDDILSKMEKIADRLKLSQPFLVGGVPRDRVIGKLQKPSDIKDVDITTGDLDILKLAKGVARVFPDNNFRTYDDGHSSVDIYGLHVDFSSHFVAPGIEEELQKMGISDINDMKLELYSRDFTMNTLLESLDFKSIYDITGRGIDDIEAGIIKCPVDPSITIGVDARRILRAIKFAIKYNFKIDEELKSAMYAHRKKIQKLPQKFVEDKVNEIVLLDADKGIEYLIEYKILPLVPLSKTVSDILVQKRKIIHAL